MKAMFLEADDIFSEDSCFVSNSEKIIFTDYSMVC
jgi:hypothetical protein